MSYLPNSEQAIIDIRKIKDYCLSGTHPRGRHKARVFREALDIDRTDASWLRQFLLEAVRHSEAFELTTDAFGSRWRVDVPITRGERCGKDNLDRESRGECAPVRNLLDAVMAKTPRAKSERPAVLDVVALLDERPNQGLTRGQVGTVVELLDQNTALVEFSDDQGRPYAIAPCPRTELLILHYVPQAA